MIAQDSTVQQNTTQSASFDTQALAQTNTSSARALNIYRLRCSIASFTAVCRKSIHTNRIQQKHACIAQWSQWCQMATLESVQGRTGLTRPF